jgi:hypothetical protein
VQVEKPYKNRPNLGRGRQYRKFDQERRTQRVLTARPTVCTVDQRCNGHKGRKCGTCRYKKSCEHVGPINRAKDSGALGRRIPRLPDLHEHTHAKAIWYMVRPFLFRRQKIQKREMGNRFTASFLETDAQGLGAVPRAQMWGSMPLPRQVLLKYGPLRQSGRVIPMARAGRPSLETWMPKDLRQSLQCGGRCRCHALAE